MQKSKILRLIDSFLPEVRGPINEAFHISKNLSGFGMYSHINTTYFGVDATLPREETIDGVDVSRYRSWFNLLRYSFCPSIFSNLKEYDILHCYEARSFSAHFGWIAARYYNKPLIISAHGSIYAYKHIVSGWPQALLYRLQEVCFLQKAITTADHVLVSSKQEFNEAIEFGVEQKRATVIPMGIDINQYNFRRVKQPNLPLQLLYVGRISRHRHLEPILHALPFIDNVHLTIVGDEALISGTTKIGYLDELKKLVVDLGIPSKVEFRPACYGEVLNKIYANADVFVSTSKYESFGHPILEAAASGLPVISTATGVAAEIIENGVTGYLVNEDPIEIRDKIELLKDFKQRELIGGNIRALIAQDFNWEKISLAYKNLYEKVLN